MIQKSSYGDVGFLKNENLKMLSSVLFKNATAALLVTKRNFINFFGTLNHIKKNYKRIQKDMKKNKLPTNKEFIEKFVKSIEDFK